ncbi:hypothetical protein IPJ72_04480 [Candidatus Peregrinibacteria bacterium]|nr:MAG: hypothetical protein IPJ72_04480 [Candidatus Peregrinibacteria bacterium]
MPQANTTIRYIDRSDVIPRLLGVLGKPAEFEQLFVEIASGIREFIQRLKERQIVLELGEMLPTVGQWERVRKLPVVYNTRLRIGGFLQKSIPNSAIKIVEVHSKAEEHALVNLNEGGKLLIVPDHAKQHVDRIAQKAQPNGRVIGEPAIWLPTLHSVDKNPT